MFFGLVFSKKLQEKSTNLTELIEQIIGLTLIRAHRRL